MKPMKAIINKTMNRITVNLKGRETMENIISKYGTDKETFEEMVRDFIADNNGHYDDLYDFSDAELNEDNEFEVSVQDEKAVYSLTETKDGNIEIGYIGTK